MDKMLTLELTEQEAKSFRAFRQWQDIFSALEDAGIFRVRNGEARLFFNHDGVLMKIQKIENPYTRTTKAHD